MPRLRKARSDQNHRREYGSPGNAGGREDEVRALRTRKEFLSRQRVGIRSDWQLHDPGVREWGAPEDWWQNMTRSSVEPRRRQSRVVSLSLAGGAVFRPPSPLRGAAVSFSFWVVLLSSLLFFLGSGALSPPSLLWVVLLSSASFGLGGSSVPSF